MEKWEYRTVVLRSAIFKSAKVDAEIIQHKCNELGKEGWELVNFQSYDLATKFMLVFKMKINE